MSMMRAWTEMLCAFTPGCMPQPPQGMWNPGCYSAGSAPLPPVSLSVETTRIVVATASINPAAECLNLKIDGLRNNGNRIERVSIHSNQGIVKIVVVVKDEPAGVYSGQIQDSAGRSVGSIYVEIKDSVERKK